MKNKLIILFAIFSICLLSNNVDALKEFQIHKLVQYSNTTQQFGSFQTSFNLLATFPTITVDNVQRRIILLPFTDLYERLKNYEEKAGEKQEATETENNIIRTDDHFQKQIFGDVGGVLIILSPEDFANSFEFNWERSLLSHKFTIPIYFIHNSEELQEIIESAKTETISTPSSPGELLHWILSDSHQLSLSSTEPYPLKPLPSVTTLHSFIGGGAGAPTILIVGHYDTFSASVSMAKGPQSASSASAFLELIRLFNNLYHGSKLQAKYNLRFLLTSGDHLNHFGSKKWLEDLDEKSAKSIEFVLTLDSLLSSKGDEPIFLYSSRPSKDPVAQKLYNSFSSTATQMGIDFELKISKVNLLASEERWEFEHFSKQKILASTISTDHSDRSLFTRNSILDEDKVNVELLSRNIRFIAESIGKYIFGTADNLSIFEGSLAVNDRFVELWVDTLLKEQRVTPYIKEELTSNLERTIKIYTSDVVKKTYPINNYIFYTLPTTNTMTVSLVKPFVFDVALSLILFAYLYLLYISLKVFGDSILNY